MPRPCGPLKRANRKSDRWGSPQAFLYPNIGSEPPVAPSSSDSWELSSSALDWRPCESYGKGLSLSGDLFEWPSPAMLCSANDSRDSSAEAYSSRVRPLLGVTMRSKVVLPPWVAQEAIVNGWLWRKDQKEIEGIQTLTYCRASTVNSLGTLMLILTVPRCFDIRARAWPWRILMLHYRRLRHR